MNSKSNGKEKKYFSAMEAAKICGVVNQTVINWINNGHLKGVKSPGGHFRIYTQDLVAFMIKQGMEIPDFLKESYGQKSLLIVDDDKGFNNVMCTYIKKNIPDVNVVQAFDGFEAGTQVVQNKFACIILDLDLPGVDGFGICRKIMEMDGVKRPSIIVVTGMQDEESEKRCMETGVAYYIKKPVSLSSLLPLVKESL